MLHHRDRKVFTPTASPPPAQAKVVKMTNPAAAANVKAARKTTPLYQMVTRNQAWGPRLKFRFTWQTSRGLCSTVRFSAQSLIYFIAYVFLFNPFCGWGGTLKRDIGQLPSTNVIVIKMRQVKKQPDPPESLACADIQLVWSHWKICQLKGKLIR